MTAIVGVMCQDGLVIGTDSSTTFGTGGGIRTIEQPSQKLNIIKDAIVVAGTGQVGLAQRFNHILEVAYDDRVFTKHHIEVGKELSKRGIQDFAFTNAKLGSYGALVGFPVSNAPHLCEFATADFQPEFKDKKIWYCSLGGGQLITDPFLGLMREIFWKDGPPNVQDGIFAVTWALEHAIALNAGGINGPVQMAIMERGDKGKLVARMLDDNDLQEHRQNIEQAKERLRSFPSTQAPAGPGIPEVPTPPAAGDAIPRPLT